MKLTGAATPTTELNINQRDYMIENTELGVLISYEDWEELQEKLENRTHSEEIEKLQKEIEKLKKEVESHKNALRQYELFLYKGQGEAHV